MLLATLCSSSCVLKHKSTLECLKHLRVLECRTHRVHPELCLLLPSRRLARFLGYAAKNSSSTIPSKVPWNIAIVIFGPKQPLISFFTTHFVQGVQPKESIFCCKTIRVFFPDFSSRCLSSQPFPQMAPMEVCQPVNTLLISNTLYLCKYQMLFVQIRTLLCKINEKY